MKNHRSNADEKSSLSNVSTDEIENKLTEYLKANAPLAARSSRLDPYKNLIEKLFLDCYSHGQIADFLITIGVSVHSTTVGRFIARKFKGLSNSNKKDAVITNNTPDKRANLTTPTNQLNQLKRPEQKSLEYMPFNSDKSKEN